MQILREVVVLVVFFLAMIAIAVACWLMLKKCFGRFGRVVDFRWYFLTVGSSMGSEAFRAILDDDDFMALKSTGLGAGLTDSKLRVRLYETTLENVQSPLEDEGSFEGYELVSDRKPKSITVMDRIFWDLGGWSDPKPIIVVLADSRFDGFYSAFRDYLNKMYMESGNIPIVRLFCSQNGELTEKLCELFVLKDEGSPFLASERQVDFFQPE